MLLTSVNIRLPKRFCQYCGDGTLAGVHLADASLVLGLNLFFTAFHLLTHFLPVISRDLKKTDFLFQE